MKTPFGRRSYGTPVPPGQRRALEILPKRPTGERGVGWWFRDPAARLRLIIFAGILALVGGTCSIVLAPPPPPVYETGYEAIGLGDVRFERPKSWTAFYGDTNLDRPTVFVAPQINELLPPTAISLYTANIADTYREVVGDLNPNPDASSTPLGTQWEAAAVGEGSLLIELPLERSVDVLVADGRTWTMRRATPDGFALLFAWSEGAPSGSVDKRLGAAAASIPELCGAAVDGEPQAATLESGIDARIYPLAAGSGWAIAGSSGAQARLFLFCLASDAANTARWAGTLRLAAGDELLASAVATVMPGVLAPIPSPPPAPTVDTLSREAVLRALVAKWVASGRMPQPVIKVVTYSSGEAAGLVPVGLRLSFPTPFDYKPARPGNLPAPTPTPSPSLGPDGLPLPTPDPASGPLRDYPQTGLAAEGLQIRQEMVVYLPSTWSFNNPGIGQRALVIALSYADGLDPLLVEDAQAAFEALIASLVISGQ